MLFFSMSYPIKLYFFVTQIGMGFLQSLVWCIPAFVLKVLLQYFQTKCLKANEGNILNDCKSCMNLFESFSLCFSNFFVIFFSVTQLYNIFMSFLFLNTMKSPTYGYGVGVRISQLCFLVQIFCNCFWLKTLTESIDESFQCVKKLKTKTQDVLLVTADKRKRQSLKCMIQRINDIEPIRKGFKNIIKWGIFPNSETPEGREFTFEFFCDIYG